MEVLSIGKTSFKLEVPYKLFQTGESKSKPLIVYLHGAGQNIKSFEKMTTSLHQIEAYHLYIQAPYADTGNIKTRADWGFLWYLFNGKQGSFIRSLEYTSEFIQSVIDNVSGFININRLCVVGYSMGAYQAGYFGLSRWKHTNDLIMINGRVKSEAFSKSKLSKCSHLNVIAIHGDSDSIVPLESQQDAVKRLLECGLSCRFYITKGGHKLSAPALKHVIKTLTDIGYKKAEI